MTILQVPLTDNWFVDNWPYTQYRKSNNFDLYYDGRNLISHNGLTRIGRPVLPANTVIQSAFLVFDVISNSNSNVRLEVDQVISNLSGETGNFNIEKSSTGTTMRFTPPIVPGEYRVNFATFMNRDFTGLSYIVRDTRTGIDPNGILSIKPKHIEITYDFVPNAPNLTKPNGGETLTGPNAITWTPPTVVTAPANELSYEVQYSGNNGQLWTTIANTGLGVTSYTHDFSTMTETSLGKIRVRAKHGSTFGAWDESDGVFTVRHNAAPSMPTNLVPSGNVVDRTLTNKLSWQHNDSPNDTQSKADVRWRLQGNLNWTNIVVNGPTQETFVSQNTFPIGPIEWQVRTYDQSGLISSWSNLEVFTSATPTNVPIITRPGSSVNVPRPIVEWTGGAQQSYQIVVDDVLNRPVWSSGEVFSTNKAVTIGFDLVNGATYKIKVRIKDGSGLFSSYAEKSVVVSYTSPARPTVTARKTDSGVNLSVFHQMPKLGQPAIKHSDVYKLIDGRWARIASHIGTSYTDYAVASEEVVQYRVRGVAVNDTFSDSDVVTITAPKLMGVWLHDVENPSTIHQFKYDGSGRSDNRQVEHAFRQFAGRKKRTVEYGEHENYAVSATLDLLRRDQDRRKLNDFMRSHATLLYRDGRGRKVYGVVPAISFEDVSYGSTVMLNLEEIDYIEEV